MSTFVKKKNKFDGIKSSINSGLHYGNVRIIPKRKGELFRRLKTKEMVTLLQLYVDETTESESISNLINNCNTYNDDYGKEENSNPIFTFYDGDEDGNNYDNTYDDNGSSFLLLDIRDEEEYNKYHIKSAKNYDTTSLRRDKLGNEIYAFKNKSDKIIIICCDNPNDGIKFSNELCNKYIDNIFFLSTSLERFCISYPDLCVGHSFPKKNNDDPLKATMHYVDRRPGMKKEKKSHRSFNSGLAMSFMSNATCMSTRTWKP